MRAHPSDRAGGLRPEPAAQSQPKALIPCAVAADNERRIVDMYRNGQRVVEIQKATGCSTVTLYKAIDKAGVPRRSSSRFYVKRQKPEPPPIRRILVAPARAYTPAQPLVAKLLEYELVDLLGDDQIGENEREAIRVLIFFLAKQKRDAARAIEARRAGTPESDPVGDEGASA